MTDSWPFRRSGRIDRVHRRSSYLLLCSLVILPFVACKNESSWYTRYPEYHPYCSTPTDMATRAVPPLGKDARVGESRLRHVTSVLRHGARTPYKAGLNCWDDYLTNEETAVWNCNLTTYLAPPPPERVTEEGASAGMDEAMFLFEKRYDALQTPEYNLSNSLLGTCQLGQLILQGYKQELANGKFLRDAYVYDDTAYDHDERMRLLDISASRDGDNHIWNHIYYRVDDEIRTLMSGQVVLRGLMGKEMDAYFDINKAYPVIPLHTADYSRDIVDPNEHVCPRLAEIREQNVQSSGFQALNQSVEARTLREFQRNVLKLPLPDQDMHAVDCLMTTMCTDRKLPNSINDYKRPLPNHRKSEEITEATLGQDLKDYGEDLFQRLYDFDVETYTYNLKANDAAYSKLSMGPLWYEIMKNVYPIIQNEIGEHPELAVFAGHDTTIMPILASLGPDVWGDKDWPPYASMVLLEIHEVNIDGNTDQSIFRSDFAFRLIYNGVVLTPKIAECPDDMELCDAAILADKVSKFAFLDTECERKYERPVLYRGAVSRYGEILSTTEGIMYFLVLVVGSALLGGVSVFVYLTGELPRRQRYSRGINNDYDSDGLSLNETNGNRFRDNGIYGEAEQAELEATVT